MQQHAAAHSTIPRETTHRLPDLAMPSPAAYLPTRPQLASDLALLASLPPSTLSSLLPSPSPSRSAPQQRSAASLLASHPPHPSQLSIENTQALARAYVADLRASVAGPELQRREEALEGLGRGVDALRGEGEELGREVKERGEGVGRDLFEGWGEGAR